MASSFQRFAVLAGFLIVVAGAIGGVIYAFTRGDGKPQPSTVEGPPIKPTVPVPQYFRGLPAPELVLLLTGQMHGYLQPCGCSRPQFGGLERRYELLTRLRKLGFMVSAADLGDVAPKHSDQQGRIKYETTLQVLQDMGYAAVGLGLTEIGMPLTDALGMAQSFQPPLILAANLQDKEDRFPDMFRRWVVHDPRLGQVEPGGPGRLVARDVLPTPRLRVGYVGLIGDSVVAEIRQKDASLTFEPVDAVLPEVLKEIQAQKPDLLVLLFQGTRGEARALAVKFPQFHVILTQDVEEPSGLSERLGPTMLLGVGHKGRYAGLVGVFSQTLDAGRFALHWLPAVPMQPPLAGLTGALAAAVRSPTIAVTTPWQSFSRFELRYQLEPLTEHYELPDEQTNPARERMKDYVVRIHDQLPGGGTFLTKYPRTLHPVQLEFPGAAYVGAAACKECHPKAYARWSESRHSHAYDNLIQYGRPFVERAQPGQEPLRIGRQFDPECVRCHSTGFDYRTGFVNAKQTPLLVNNGCENCHGPASLHVAKPKDAKFGLPLRLSLATVDKDCRRCHDADNDPKFELDLYWPKISHGRE